MKLGRRKLVCAIIICVAALSCGWWLVERSKPRLKIVQNDGTKAQDRLSFTLTNPTTIPYHYWVITEFKTNKIWNVFPPAQVLHSEEQKQLPPKQAATISVTPPTHSGKWRIAAVCSRSQGAPATLATRVADSLEAWNLVWIAEKLEIYDKAILVPGPEMRGETST